MVSSVNKPVILLFVPCHSEGGLTTPLKLSLIKFLSVCNKRNQIADVVGKVSFGDVVVVMKTWLTGGLSDHKSVDDVTSARYSFSPADCTHRTCGELTHSFVIL